MRVVPSSLGQLAREPLVLLLVGGALLFGFWKIVSAGGPRVVELDASVLSALESRREAQLRLPLPAAEHVALRDRYIEGELLLAEAVHRELYLADASIRTRLIQLMRAELAVPPPEPTRVELELWLGEHFDRFASPEAVTLDQIPFAPAESVTDEVLAETLAQLRAGADPAAFGTQKFAAGRRLVRKSFGELEEMLGRAFSEEVQSLPKDEWSGPFDSPYARHLVRVVERHERELPTLDAIENYLKSDWFSEKRRVLRAERMDEIRARYQLRWIGE